MTLAPFTISAAEEGHTLAKVLRSRLHETPLSWNQVRAIIESRRVTVGDAVCTDPARRVHEGESVTLLDRAAKPIEKSTPTELVIRHFDEHLVVVEKPSGLSSVRHPAELKWPDKHRRLDPTLQDVTQWAIGLKLRRPAKSLPPLRIVHRLDKETSGLLVFARSVLAERELGMQFRHHTVVRRYLALVPGMFTARTIRSLLIRDRGDGRRGSTPLPDPSGKEAITHVEVEERLIGHTLLSCRLETGRTHQIRIHLAEAGHPVLGDKVYGKIIEANVPRLALHATELGFEHPVTGAHLHWSMPLPPELQTIMERYRRKPEYNS